MKNKTILFGVTGGIAAYKSVAVARRMTEEGASVHVIMTDAAAEFVGPVTFSALTGHPVARSMFGDKADALYHINASGGADLILIAPATADFIAKTACGLAPDWLSSVVLAADCPILMAPAMNNKMYLNPATQENLRIVRERGIKIVGPVEGPLAEGYGIGRMAPEDAIIAAAKSCFVESQTLKNKRVIVTAGGTRERIDAVRFIGNRSSGKMGYALAEAAAARGAKVTLISGPTDLPRPANLEFIKVTSADEMRKAVLKRYEKADIVIMAAAVAAIKAAGEEKGKITKNGLRDLKLEPTADILKELGALKTKQTLVGFAAETSDLIKNAQAKIEKKNLDLIVANDVGRTDIGFGSDYNQATILTADGRVQDTPRLTKAALAALIIDEYLV